MWYLKSIYRRIKRCFQYCLYVFKEGDADWDFGYLLRLIELKLGWMEKEMRYNSVFPSVNLEAELGFIHQARTLLKRIDADEYHDMYYDYIEYKERGSGFALKAHLPIVIETEPSNKQADLDYLCRILQKHLFHWWD